MLIESTQIVDTFAEAFRLRYVRLIVTAADPHWLDAAVRAACGYGTSVIGCDAEIGVERLLEPEETPDGRPGVAMLACGFSVDGVGKAIANRTAQCLLTCPTASVFDGLPAAEERRRVRPIRGSPCALVRRELTADHSTAPRRAFSRRRPPPRLSGRARQAFALLPAAPGVVAHGTRWHAIS